MVRPFRFGSICSGYDAASLAFRPPPLNWECAFVAEPDPAPATVMMHRHGTTRPLFPPDLRARNRSDHDAKEWKELERWAKAAAKMPSGGAIPNLGDITRYKEWPDYAIDLLIGGTPCQGLSIAGLRKGLDDPRSSLMLVYGAIAARYRPTWLLWENVPGVFSLDEGRAFATFLGLLSGRKIDAPEGGWRNSGVVAGDANAYGLAWRTFDAQYFGLAQRRARVFVVGYLGDWRPPAAVLFEPEGLSGNPPPRRQTGERIAPTIAARTRGGGGIGTDTDLDGGLIVADVAGTIDASGQHGSDENDAMDGRLVAYGGNNTSGPIEVATALNAHPSAAGRQDFETETFIVEQQPWSITPSNSNKDYNAREAEKAQTVTTQTGQQPSSRGGDVVVMGFSTKDHGQDAADELAPTLRAMGHDSSHANGGGQAGVAIGFNSRQDPVVTGETTGALDTMTPQAQAVAFKASHYTRDKDGAPSDVAPALSADADRGDQDTLVLAMNLRGREGGAMPELDDVASVRAAEGGSSRSYIVGLLEYVVRRLTPRECERLQGAPDDFTLVPYRGKPMADSPRYKMLGNSFAMNVVAWLGGRIELVRTIMEESDENQA